MVFFHLFFSGVFLLVLLYLCYRFYNVLANLKQPILFPTSDASFSSVRKHPDRRLNPPNVEGQKTDIFIYGGMLLFVIILFLLGIIFNIKTFSFYLVLIFPFGYSQDVMNLFAITENGILSGVRFVPWGSIRSYEFIPITIAHKYYGYAKEANNGYELKMKTKGFPISCVVTNETTKEGLEELLHNHLLNTASKSL